MKRLILVLITITINTAIWSQKVTLDKVSYESYSTFKSVAVEIKIDGVKLDTINRIKLLGNAFAYIGKSKEYISDSFYSDEYQDNSDNKYTIVFDSISKQINNFEKVTGTLRYFHPSTYDKSIVVIENAKNTFNSNVLSKNSDEIKVIPINGLILHKLNKRKKKLPKYLDGIILKNRLDKNLFIETLSKHFDNYKDFNSLNKLSDFIIFYIEQPHFKVVSIHLEDSNNKNRTGYYSVEINSKLNGPKSAIWISSNFGKKLNDDYKIEIRYENKNSIKDFEFELSNLQLN